jgi:hypothetical protein
MTGSEVCGLFGDDWENKLQYEDKHGTTIGCYVERCFIERFAKERDKDFSDMVDKMEEDIKKGKFFIPSLEL